MARQSSPIGRLLPILVVLLIVACASIGYLVTQNDGLPFGLALAPASATPSPTATRRPPTATNTATALPSPTATPIPPSPTLVPTLSPLDRLSQLEPQISAASNLAQTGQYPEAISAWNELIDSAPGSAEAYFGRGRASFEAATQFRPLPENALELLHQALDDLNQAISLGPVRGRYYLTRIDILDWLAKLEPSREKRAPYFEQMMLDVQSAAEYDLATPFSEPNPGSLLVQLGRCQEAMNYLGQQVAANPAAIPPAVLDTLIARTYLCYGQPRSANLYANMAYSLDPTPERAWVRAITLYNLGRYNETLAALDDLLEANPDSPGDRYDLRALVHYHRREYELAQSDLDLGAQYDLVQNGLSEYVSALLARQSGDQDAAEELFIQAEASLSLEYGVVLDRVRAELNLPIPDRGIPTLPNPVLRYQDDPPETIQPPATLFEPQEILLPVRYDGSGPFHLLGNETLNLHLYPPVSVDILFVDSLTLRLTAGDRVDFSAVTGALWDFNQGSWVPVELAPGENSIEEPSRFVNSQGDIYLSIQNESAQTLPVANLNITLAIAGGSGNP